MGFKRKVTLLVHVVSLRETCAEIYSRPKNKLKTNLSLSGVRKYWWVALKLQGNCLQLAEVAISAISSSSPPLGGLQKEGPQSYETIFQGAWEKVVGGLLGRPLYL